MMLFSRMGPGLGLAFGFVVDYLFYLDCDFEALCMAGVGKWL